MPSAADQLPPTAQSLALRIKQLEREVRELRAARRLPYAAIDGGALLVRDDTGSLRAIVGQQADGTSGVNVVNGPVPPTPSAPIVEPALAALAVTWNGAFTDAVAAPLDWARVEVHIGADPAFEPDQTTLRATIETPQGGTVTIPLGYTDWWVRLRSRTLAGVPGPATPAVSGTPRQAAGADIQADAIDGKVITGATVRTAASGARLVLGGNELNEYQADGTLIASITPDGSSYGGGFWTRGFQSPLNVYSMLAGGSLEFNTVDKDAYGEGGAQWLYYTADHQTKLTVSSGTALSGYDAAWLNLTSQSDTQARPKAELTDNTGTGRCDLDVNGLFTARNIATGSVSITPVASTPTSTSVSGLNLPGTTARAFVTAQSAVPGTVTEVTTNNVTTDGLTIWLHRTNTTPTTIFYLMISS